MYYVDLRGVELVLLLNTLKTWGFHFPIRKLQG